MDVLLKKYFWVVNVAVVGVCMVFLGRASTHFIEASWLAGDDARPTLARRPPVRQSGWLHGVSYHLSCHQSRKNTFVIIIR